MIQGLIQWLVVVIIISLLYWIITLIPAPAQIQRIALVVCVVIIVLALVFIILPFAAVHIPLTR